jgi:hypothetical protein
MKKILVKSHMRNGRIVRSHGRVKKENRWKRKTLDLAKAIDRSTYKTGSMQEHLTAVRAEEKEDSKNPYMHLTEAYKRNLAGGTYRNKPLAERRKALVEMFREAAKRDKKMGRDSHTKSALHSKFPYSK